MKCPGCGITIEISKGERCFSCSSCGLDFRKFVLGGIFKRFFSFLLDFFFLIFPIFSYFFAYFFLSKLSDAMLSFENMYYSYNQSIFSNFTFCEFGFNYGDRIESVMEYLLIPMFIISFFFLALEIYLVIFKKESFGKSLFGLKVSHLGLTLPDGGKMFLRCILGLLVVPVSIFLIPISKFRQGVHDMLFSTILVDVRKVEKIFGGFFENY